MGLSGVLLSSAIGLSIFASQAVARPSVDQQWKALDWKFDRLDISFNNTACYGEEKNFLACIRGVDVILDFDEQSLLILPESYRQANPEYDAPVIQFGSVSIVKPPVSKAKTNGELIRENRRVAGELHAAWKQLYIDGIVGAPSARVDFDAIIKWLHVQSFFAERESEIVGAVTNAFYEIRYDPHTAVLPIATFNSMSEPEEEFVGIGVAMQIIDKEGKKHPIINQVIEDSPAHKAGLLPKDLLLSIDGTDVANLTLDEVRKRIQGVVGTDVTIQVLRKSDTFEYVLTRKTITQKNVRAKLIGANHDIGYVRLQSFMESDPTTKLPTPCTDLKIALGELEGTGARSIILDLRGNPGGFMGEASCVANLFLDLKAGEPIVMSKSLNEEDEDSFLPEVPNPVFNQLPLVVLVDAGSASASEIVAGALQDYQRGFLIGDDTYGKGTVQGFKKLGLKNLVILKKTIARFYLPSGRTNQLARVRPDVKRYRVPNPTEDDKTSMREEDYYNALPPLGTEWQQPRPKVIAQLEQCMAKTGTAGVEYTRHLEDVFGSDYQLYSAVDAANCVISEGLWSPQYARPHFELPEWLQKKHLKDFVDFIRQNIEFRLDDHHY